MTEVGAGVLLLATPVLQDPNFAGSVVLLLEANDEGALGVVLNRPTGVAVHEVFQPWSDLASDPPVLFEGGPVSTDGALAVALRASEGEGAPGLRVVVDRLALLDLDTPVELVAGDVTALRVFAGYAGWGAAQLQGEIDEGAWYVVPGRPEDVFRPDTTRLWRDVMRRQPGMLAMHATRPVDPGLN